MDRLLEATLQAEQRHFWFLGLRRFLRPLVASAVAGRAEPRILDCGCGTGANLTLLAGYGREFGLELASVGLVFAKTYGHHRLVQGNAVHLPFASESFELVTALDVLPNLSDEEEPIAVREMLRVLVPGGTLILNVAALTILRGHHSVFGHERRRYRRRRIRPLLEGAGFTLERLTYTNCSLFPLMLAVRWIQRLAGLPSPEEAGVDLSLPPAPINAALAGLLAVEAAALRVANMPIGSSLLAVARKPRP